MSLKRFIVYDGWVTSVHDGDRHFITCEQVMRLHRVRPRDCFCVRTHDYPQSIAQQLAGIDTSKYLTLTPHTEAIGYFPISPTERAQYPIDASWDERHEDIEGARLVHRTREIEKALGRAG